RIGRTGGARARAGLGEIAHARRSAALDRRGLEGVGRTLRAAACAVLRQVAESGGGPALDARGPEGVGRAVIVHTVTALGHVTEAGRGAADSRARRIHRTGRHRGPAELSLVARARGS